MSADTHQRRPPAVPAEPKPFGKYHLLERIGSGGMAEIWKARAAGPDGFEKLLVVKKILPRYANDRAFVKMLIAEAKVTSLLQHPNIIQIFELGEIDGCYYIAMELVDGADLLSVLSRCTLDKLRVPTEIALYIVAEVCKGLAHAHAATDAEGRPLNIVHRDVSPSNILLSLSGDVKIMDFGVAAADIGPSHPVEPDRPSLKGKLGYMSSEQVAGLPIDRRSDVFALGVILFECLTLKRLFVGKTDVQTLLNIREANVDRKFKRHSYIPKPIRSLLRKALAKDPDERFATATDLQEAILDYLFDNRLRVSARSVSSFLNQVIRPTPRRPPTAPSLRPTARHHSAIPELPAEAHAAPTRQRRLRRVDLTPASFRFRNDGEPVFGPVGFEHMTQLLHSRCIGPHEWVSINGSDWIRAADVGAIVDLAPALFEEEPNRPLLDGPLNPVRAPHVFHQVHDGKLGGKLRLTSGTHLQEVYFDRGRPVFVTSNLKQALLGAALVRDGLISPAALDAALATGERLGASLVAAGALTDRQLADALLRQFLERLLHCFSWATGWYEFFVGLLPPHRFDLPSAHPPELLMYGIRRHYDLPTLRRIFDPYLHKPIIMSRRAHGRDALGLAPEELGAKNLLLSGATLSQLLHAHGSTEAVRLNLLRVCFALYHTDALTFRSRTIA